MKYIVYVIVITVICALLAVVGCASPPKINADSIPDGAGLCWTNTGIGGTQTLTFAKLDRGVVRNGEISIKPSCETAIRNEQTPKQETVKP